MSPYFRSHVVAAALVAAALLALPVAAGGTRSGPRDRVSPGQPHPQALTAAASCEEVREHVVAATVETLVRNRYWWYMMPWSDAGGGDRDGASDASSTNNQEAGVDELDLVKHDGHHLFVAQDDTLRVVDAWPPESSRLLAELPLGGSASGLFLHQQRALVMASFVGDGDWTEPSWNATRLHLVDVAEPSAPATFRTVDVEGSLVGARMIDGHVFAALWTWVETPAAAWELMWRDDLGLPVLDWDASDEEREAAAELARQILTPLVADIVAGVDLDQLLPRLRDTIAGSPDPVERPLLDCADLYLPAAAASLAVLSVVHLDLGAADPAVTPVEASGILADGWTVYASRDSFYVAQSGGSWWWGGWPGSDHNTVIHRFALAPGTAEPVRYSATGEVPGWLLNQFSMGEYDGHLRVASTAVNWWWDGSGDGAEGSTVSVLRDDGFGRLALVGQVSGIAPGEQIYAARFLGPRGYLVTFLQVDPLFTLDLSDPAAPSVVGELEVPGYSAYLHPLGDDHLLAVGMDADEEGRVQGLAVSLFDVSDFARPRLAGRYALPMAAELWSWSEALSDHHAFTFHRGVLSIPAVTWNGFRSFSGLVVMAVDVEDGIRELGRVDHNDLPPNQGWGWDLAWMRRSVYFDDVLLSLSDRGVKANQLLAPEAELAAVPFFAP